MIVQLIEGGKQDARDWAADLQDERIWVRQRAAAHYSECPEEAAEAVGSLVAALEDRDPMLRRFAAQALAGVGVSAVEALVLALVAERAVAREWAALLLGKLGPQAEAALPELERLAREDQAAEVRWAASSALASIGGVPVEHGPRRGSVQSA